MKRMTIKAATAAAWVLLALAPLAGCLPVFLHTADPPEFFEEMDYTNERWLELALFPNRRYPSAANRQRLREARETGAEMLVTACPKCQIHLTCAQTNTDIDLKVVDLYDFIFSAFDGENQ